MVAIRFGRWNSAAGQWFVWKRIYWRGYKWTPFCHVERRRYKVVDPGMECYQQYSDMDGMVEDLSPNWMQRILASIRTALWSKWRDSGGPGSGKP